MMTKKQEEEANKKYNEKIHYYTDLVKKGMDGGEAWFKATEKHGDPIAGIHDHLTKEYFKHGDKQKQDEEIHDTGTS
jgi:hypothetical protein